MHIPFKRSAIDSLSFGVPSVITLMRMAGRITTIMHVFLSGGWDPHLDRVQPWTECNLGSSNFCD